MQAPLVSLVLDVTCLCAQWCGTCRDYEQVFEQCQAALPANRYRWIDIEDEAEVVGDLDIETFPTLLVTHEGRALFAGPVLPRLSDIQRLLQALSQGAGLAQPDVPSAMHELAQRLR
jgi:thioredoxin 1